MVLNPSLSARLSRAGIVALPAMKRLPNGGIELRFLLTETEGERADPPSRVPGAALDRSIVTEGGEGFFDRWTAECERADAVVAAHFDLGERHIFLQNSLVVVHFFVTNRTESVRWVEGIGWAGW